mmetsp:Transcript_30918/g.45827  ORF Transcript_30918/g.45827 Transcript_30918/m.45827 type:complete len:156 (-) Transcript_30918:316-783(-)
MCGVWRCSSCRGNERYRTSRWTYHFDGCLQSISNRCWSTTHPQGTKQSYRCVNQNNAGFPLQGPIEVIPLDMARRQFEVNLFGLSAITQAVLPTMRKQKSGTIINVSSGAGKFHACSLWCLVSRLKACARRMERLLSFGFEAIRCQCCHHRTRND